MINLDDELAQEYLAECGEHLGAIETDLLAIGKNGGETDEELVNRIFRAAHSIKGGAGFFDLAKVRELAHRMEDALALIRSREMAPEAERIRVLLRATDKLSELLQNAAASDQADITEIMAALARMCDEAECRHPESGQLRVLLVEDDFASRLLMQTFLSRYGDCHIAVNGREAVEAFQAALERGQPYHLICMDLLMPEMDGREAVRQVRALEEARGILSTHGVKIIMTTAVDSIKQISRCFRELCDDYLVKPIDLFKLLGHMKAYGLVDESTCLTRYR